MIIKSVTKLLSLTIIYTVKTLWIATKAAVVHFYQRPYHTLLNVIFLVILFFIIDTTAKIEDKIILSQISDNTINQIISQSNYTRRFDANKVDKNAKREFLQVGAPIWSQQSVVRAVLFYSRKEKLSIEHQAVLLAIVEIESGFNPMARAATTSACGLFQFIKATGERYGLKREDCMDPWLNAKSGIEHYLDNYEERIKTRVSTLKKSKKAIQLFEMGYHLHHDGQQSQSPSDKANSAILRGIPFLLKTHDILKEQSQSKENLTGVTEHLIHNLRSIAEKTKNLLMTF